MGSDRRVEVCPEDDLEPGDRRFTTVDGVPVGILNVEGDYFALENNCPHQGGPVCQGKVQGLLEAEYTVPGERIRETVSDDEFMIACPWHGWEYDLQTGIHRGDTDIALRTFDVVVEDGVVFVEPGGDGD